MKLKNLFKSNFFKVVSQIFRFSFITFVILFLVEYLEPGFVTNWFNPIWLLILALISSILALVNKN